MRHITAHPRVPLDPTRLQSLHRDLEALALAALAPGSTLRVPAFQGRVTASPATLNDASGQTVTLRVLPLAPAQDVAVVGRAGLARYPQRLELAVPLSAQAPGVLADPLIPPYLVGSSAQLHQGLYDQLMIDGTVQPTAGLVADRFGNLRVTLDRAELHHKVPLPQGQNQSTGTRTLTLWREQFPFTESGTQLSFTLTMPDLGDEELLMVELRGLSSTSLGVFNRLYPAARFGNTPVQLAQRGAGEYQLTLDRTLLTRDGLGDFTGAYMRVFSARVARTRSASSPLQALADLDLPVAADLTGLELYLVHDETDEVVDLRDEVSAEPTLLSTTSDGQLVVRLNALTDTALLQRVDLSGPWRICVSRVPVALSALYARLSARLVNLDGLMTVRGVPGVRLVESTGPNYLNRTLTLTAQPLEVSGDHVTLNLASGPSVVEPRFTEQLAVPGLWTGSSTTQQTLATLEPDGDWSWTVCPVVRVPGQRVRVPTLTLAYGQEVVAALCSGVPATLEARVPGQAPRTYGPQSGLFTVYPGRGGSTLRLNVTADDLALTPPLSGYDQGVELKLLDGGGNALNVTWVLR